MYNEFVVEFQDGKMDWIDPVNIDDVTVTDSEIIVNATHQYRYALSNVAKWAVRPYSPETTYDSIS